jgi:hypothetical protein
LIYLTTLSITDYIASNDTMFIEKLLCKDVEGSGLCLISGTNLETASTDLGKPGTTTG